MAVCLKEPLPHPEREQSLAHAGLDCLESDGSIVEPLAGPESNADGSSRIRQTMSAEEFSESFVRLDGHDEVPAQTPLTIGTPVECLG